MPITYTVAGHDPATHRIRFRLTIPAPAAGAVELVLPVWAPGAYEIRESAREVRELSAHRSGDAQPLPVLRVEKNRWRISTPATDALEIDYTVYARDLADDGLDADATHMLLNATRCFPYVEGRQGEPVEVEFHPPAGWKVFAELPRVSDDPPRVRARDYEELVDTPIDMGTPVEIEWRSREIPHRFLLCGGPGNYDLDRLREDLPKVVESAMAYIGDTPLSSYTFFAHLHDRPRGGLEHRASTALVVNRRMFRPAKAYGEFLALCAHEYFHLYNVKRIRPAILGPFDFAKENYTRLLWLMEGTTDYLALMLLRYAGLNSPSKTLELLATKLRTYSQIPGRLVKSLEEASFGAWVELYKPYEESANQSVSYYLKGAIASLCLDLEIRHRSSGERSLQTVFRYLWTEYGRAGRGLGEGEAQPIFERATGLDLQEFFDGYIRGTQELDVAPFARYAGLLLAPAPREDPEKPLPGYLGAEVGTDRGEIRVRSVLDGSPARIAGITPEDEIVAIDGIRVTPGAFSDSLASFPPGTPAEILLFRRGISLTVPVTFGTPPPEKWVFTASEHPTDLERTIYEGWMQHPWEPPPSPSRPGGSSTATPPPPS